MINETTITYIGRFNLNAQDITIYTQEEVKLINFSFMFRREDPLERNLITMKLYNLDVDDAGWYSLGTVTHKRRKKPAVDNIELVSVGSGRDMSIVSSAVLIAEINSVNAYGKLGFPINLNDAGMNIKNSRTLCVQVNAEESIFSSEIHGTYEFGFY